jgi:hypothetical protein
MIEYYDFCFVLKHEIETYLTDTCYCSFLSWIKQTNSWIILMRIWNLFFNTYQKTGKISYFQQTWLLICKSCVTLIKRSRMPFRLMKGGFKLLPHLTIDQPSFEDYLTVLIITLLLFFNLIDLWCLSVFLNACLYSTVARNFFKFILLCYV